MIVAQLSDLHICRTGESVFGGRDSAQSLSRCIDALNALRPRAEIVMLSGDLVNTGHPDEYIRLQSILKQITAPYYLMPGNHDERAALRAAFADHTYLGSNGPIQYSVDRPEGCLIALDTVAPGAEHGELDAARLQWLEQALDQRRERTCMVFMHHPPFESGIAAMDAGRVRSEAFWALLKRHRQVKRIACGHVHRSLHTQQRGIAACIAPSTAAQLGLEPDANGKLAVTAEPAGFLLHVTQGDDIVSHHIGVAA